MAQRPAVHLDTKLIRDMLDERGIGVTIFAQQVGIPRQTIWNTLNTGRASKPFASRIARGLGLKAADITKDSDDSEPEQALAS